MNKPLAHALPRALLMAALIGAAAGLAHAQSNPPAAAPPAAADAAGQKLLERSMAQGRGGAPAEPGPVLEREAAQPGRSNQRIERIHIEDSDNRIDELRVGGQTRSITVQPKIGAPAYSVQPADVTRPAPPESAPGSAGQRTWKVLSF